MAELSPAAQAAQAALDAFCVGNDNCYLEGDPDRLAAFLRAVCNECSGLPDGADWQDYISNIANELENYDA